MRTVTNAQPLLRLRDEADRYAVYVATAAFTLIAAAQATGNLDVPGGTATLFLYPGALLALNALRPGILVERELRVAAAWSALVIVAFILVPRLTASGLVAVGLPVAIGAGALVARLPAAAVVVALLLTAIGGTFEAYVGFGTTPLIDLTLAAIWIAVLARVALGRPFAFKVWPAVLACCLYIGVTLVDFVTAEDTGVAWIGFHTTVWLMMSFLVLAYAGWSRQTYRRIAFGFVGVTIVVAGYATLRWFTGPSGAEAALAHFAGGGINVDPIDKHLKPVGSFQTSHQLAFWPAFMAPFCAAIALWARGRWRLLALVGVLLCISAMAASEARGPLVGFLAGIGLVLLLHQAARAFPGFKGGILALAVAGIATLGGGALALSASDPAELDRYTNILEPRSDPTFIQRELKWEQVLIEVDKHPFGKGLGTGGAGAQSSQHLELSTFNIDSSYLKIAYEQGMLVMILFIVAVVGLLASLAVASVRTRSREAAAMGFGACGALLSILISFYTGMYIETPAVLAGWLIVGLGLAYHVARSPQEHEGDNADESGDGRGNGDSVPGKPAPRRSSVPATPARPGWATARAR